MILVVCALAPELGGFIPRADVDVVAVGVGPIEAALGSARALAARSYTCAINAGIAGGFRGRAVVGDAVAVASECFADLGLEGGATLALPGASSGRQRKHGR